MNANERKLNRIRGALPSMSAIEFKIRVHLRSFASPITFKKISHGLNTNKTRNTRNVLYPCLIRVPSVAQIPWEPVCDLSRHNTEYSVLIVLPVVALSEFRRRQLGRLADPAFFD